jgi:hypothetical protein
MYDKQCCSLNELNQRCKNETFKQSKHCVDHYQIALQLYLNYKKMCNIANGLNIDEKIENRRKKIAHLKKCHHWLVKAYNARLEHRNYAFAPECHDFGHNLQFQITQEKIDKCREELCKMSRRQILLHDDDDDDDYPHRHEDDEDGEDDDEDDDELNSALLTMHKFVKKKKMDEKETNRIISHYIRSNNIALAAKEKIANSCIKLLNALCKTDDPIINHAVYYLIQEMYIIDYFSSNFEPKKCPNCDCGNFSFYEFTLLNKMKDSNCTVKSLFDVLSVDCVGFIHNLVLSNLRKISEVSKDIVTLFKIYGNQVLVMQLETTWKPKMARMVVTEGRLKRHGYEKKSQYLAISRKRESIPRDIMMHDFIDDSSEDEDP